MCFVLHGRIEGNVEKKEGLWNDLDRVVGRVGNGYKLCVIKTRVDGLDIR